MPAMTPAGLRLRKAAQAVAAARDRRDDLMVAMRAEGASLRDIAEAAQVSHPTVRRVLLARGVDLKEDED